MITLKNVHAFLICLGHKLNTGVWVLITRFKMDVFLVDLHMFWLIIIVECRVIFHETEESTKLCPIDLVQDQRNPQKLSPMNIIDSTLLYNVIIVFTNSQQETQAIDMHTHIFFNNLLSFFFMEYTIYYP